MKKGNHIIIKLLIVIIVILCVDRGSSFMLTGSSIQIILNHDHSDIEEPHQHQLFSINDVDKLLETFKFDFSSCDQSPLKFLFLSESLTKDFSGSIWQPPEFV